MMNNPDGVERGSVALMGAFARHAGVGCIAVGLIAGLGYVPTIRIAGPEAIGSMLAGCGVSVAAGCVGAAVLAWSTTRPASEAALAVLMSTALRFLTVLLLVIPVALSGFVDRTVFVVWVAVSYLPMLMLDTFVAVRVSRKRSTEVGS
ncbi:MAG: hypothetical protein IID38_09700 [Planctomycetes bacterium]|nr:hypothetical protein [Planctomycetota bacterium]